MLIIKIVPKTIPMPDGDKVATYIEANDPVVKLMNEGASALVAWGDENNKRVYIKVIDFTNDELAGWNNDDAAFKQILLSKLNLTERIIPEAPPETV